MDFSPFATEAPTEEQLNIADAQKSEDYGWSPFGSIAEPESEEAEAFEEEEEGENSEPEPNGEETPEQEEEKDSEPEPEKEGDDSESDEAKDESLEPNPDDKPFMVELRSDAKSWRKLAKDHEEVVPMLDEALSLGKAWVTGDVGKIFELSETLGRETAYKIFDTVLENQAEAYIAGKYGIPAESFKERLSTEYTVELSPEEEEALAYLPDEIKEALEAKINIGKKAVADREIAKQQFQKVSQDFEAYRETLLLQSVQYEIDSFWAEELDGVAKELAEGIDISAQKQSIINAAYANFFSEKEGNNKDLVDRYERVIRSQEGERAKEFVRRSLRSGIKASLKQEFEVRNIQKVEPPKEKTKKVAPPVLASGKGAPPAKESKASAKPLYLMSRAEQERELRKGIEERKRKMAERWR